MMRDWREDALETVERLRGVSFCLRSYRTYRPGWDHDHCEMCSAKFSEPKLKIRNTLHEGYASTDSYALGAEFVWLCAECFMFLKPRLELIDKTERN